MEPQVIVEPKVGDAHLVFNGASNKLKFFFVTEQGPELRHEWECHDVGVADANPPNGDEYGHLCKCPPGKGYAVGTPQRLDPPEPPYGYFFIPIGDDHTGDMSEHGRAGIGIHGGGSDLPNPFAPQQGWEWTYGCLRMQNCDVAMLADSTQFTQSQGGAVTLDVDWP
jgi:hypothetical protein